MQMEEIVRMDSKHRLVLNKRLRKAAGIEEGKDLVAIPFWGGVVVASPRGKKFAGSLSGFGFEESKHQATKYLMTSRKHANTGHAGPLRSGR